MSRAPSEYPLDVLSCLQLRPESKIYQAWGAGRSVTSVDDKKEVGGLLCPLSK